MPIVPTISISPQAIIVAEEEPSLPLQPGSEQPLPQPIERALYRQAMLIARQVDRASGDNSSHHQVHTSAVNAVSVSRHLVKIPPEAD